MQSPLLAFRTRSGLEYETPIRAVTNDMPIKLAAQIFPSVINKCGNTFLCVGLNKYINKKNKNILLH